MGHQRSSAVRGISAAIVAVGLDLDDLCGDMGSQQAQKDEIFHKLFL